MNDFKVEENWTPHDRKNNKQSYDACSRYLSARIGFKKEEGKFALLTNPPIKFGYILFCILNEQFYSFDWENLGPYQQTYIEQYITQCVDCLSELDKLKKSMVSDSELQKKFPNIESKTTEKSSQQSNQKKLSSRASTSIFLPATELPNVLKNYKEAIEGFHLESTKLACELITSFKRDDFTQKIDHLSKLIKTVTAYQNDPTDFPKLKKLITEARKFNQYIDDTDPLWGWCRNIIGYGLILLGKTLFSSTITTYGESVLKPQFMFTKEAVEKLVSAAKDAYDANDGTLITISSPTN